MPRIPIRRLLILLLGATTLLAAVLAINTWRQPSRQRAVEPAHLPGLDTAEAPQRLAAALRYRTISEEGKVDANADQFEALRTHLAESFPRVHAGLSLEVVGGHSLLYRWQGRDRAARPVMFLAHQDVVPIAPGTEQDWTVPPFSGTVRDGYIWGRGAWDDKGNLMAMLEAAEARLALGFQPDRTIYFAFGHDEENGGGNGAAAIAALLERRGERLAVVVDEGWFVTEGILPGIARPVALVGTAEKSMVTLELRTSGAPGHSSAPGRDGVVAQLARALVRLDAAPMPPGISPVTEEMLDTLAPEMTLPARVLVSNRWLFGALVERALKQSPGTAAMVGTTTALTVLDAGDKQNVLPGTASALVNVRMVPGDTPQAVLARAAAAVDDERVQIRIHDRPHAATAPTPTSAGGYRALERVIRQTYPEAVVAPALLIGGTDSRHFAGIADEIYRMTPVRAAREDLARYHGTDERISVQDYGTMIRFYALLMAELAAGTPPTEPHRAQGDGQPAADV